MPRSDNRSPRHADLSSQLKLYSESDIPSLLSQSQNPLILVLDGVQDPQNLGACIRTAECAGCAFVVITKKNFGTSKRHRKKSRRWCCRKFTYRSG
jgi:23S rRNA (guanosine2251-2'-O)-methyltransferase